MRTAAFAGLMACALITAPAFAADNEGASLKLKAPTTTTKFIHEGSVWNCEGDSCASAKVQSLPVARACRKLAGQLGEVTAFSYRGVSLDDAAIAQCNTAAKPKA
ncbi:hypothetical protein [Caulobacter sp. SSI4214]|uniref:CC_3452 family protein n=1 Tax=Caulobacter sp. SSI4214 TaxID=2575739 RepID=UPI0014397C14|nr:hypothetical protein [Caulobacter sp. SSI4214]